MPLVMAVKRRSGQTDPLGSLVILDEPIYRGRRDPSGVGQARTIELSLSGVQIRPFGGPLGVPCPVPEDRGQSGDL